jgi:hypothetical protein
VTDLQELDTGSPDFAALNGSWLDDEGAMTPRMACWLWQATLVSADTWGFVADRKGIDESLPPIARPFAHGRWLHEFILGFDRLADRIASGRGDTDMLARCTAEELALHEIINLAEAYVRDAVLDVDLAAGLPDHGDQDKDFNLMREVSSKTTTSPCSSTRRSTASKTQASAVAPTSTRGTGSSGSADGDKAASGTHDQGGVPTRSLLASCGGKRWVVEYAGPVLDELDAAVEGSAIDHVERDVGVAVVDAF